jgi:toxin HigB-1
VIKTFNCKKTEKLFNDTFVKKFESISDSARRKLLMINAAISVDILRLPPSNRLEALKGDRRGQYSIRVNQQFRVCFTWKDGHSYNVEIVDYH